MTTLARAQALTWHGPSTVAVRGNLVVIPGRGESPSVYERFGLRMATDAYRTHAVLAPTAVLTGTAVLTDTDGPEATVEQISTIVADAEPGLPLVLIGSDTGAAFAARLVADGRVPAVSGLVLAGLPTESEASSARDWDGELDVRTACPTHRARITGAGVAGAQLFSDVPPEWVDPSVPTRLNVPILGVHGQDDVISRVKDARRWYSAAPRCELITFTGGRHDILNDQMHRTVAASIVLFLERLRGGIDLAPIAVPESVRAR